MGFRKRTYHDHWRESLSMAPGIFLRHCVYWCVGGLPGGCFPWAIPLRWECRTIWAPNHPPVHGKWFEVIAQVCAECQRCLRFTHVILWLGYDLFSGSPLVTWIYGEQYAGNGWIVTIFLAFNAGVNAVAFSFSRALLAIERADIDFLINFTALFS